MPGKRNSKSDLDNLQGTWTLTGLEVDGNRQPEGMLAGAQIVVKGDRFQSLGMGHAYEGKLTLDEAASPRTFDLKFTKGPEKGNTALGIYEVEGDDWKLCITARPNATRPKKFATKAGSGWALETLKRGQVVKAANTRQSAAKPVSARSKKDSGPATEIEGEWKLVSGFLDGKPMDAVAVEWGKRVVSGNATTLAFGPQIYQQATFELNGAANPKQIDYQHSKGMFAGKKQLGIYECDGATLRLSASTPGTPRPQDFAPGKGRNVTEFKRLL